MDLNCPSRSSDGFAYTPRVSTILRKPSVAVAAWAVLVLGLFAWRGDLRLDGEGAARSDVEAAQAATDARNAQSDRAAAREGSPVVVRRNAERDRSRVPHGMRRGRVFDSMGFLVVGAEVVARDAVADQGPCRTDADGGFEVDLPTQSVCDVLVRADGKRPVWRRTTAVAPDPLIVGLEPAAPWDAMPQPPSPIAPLRGEGIVRDVDGKPLAGAFVNAVGTGCWARTDDIGRFELPLPSIHVNLRAQAEAPGGSTAPGGWAAVAEPFVSPRERGIVPLPELVAERAGSIHGSVRSGGGQAAPGVPVVVRGPGVDRMVETGPSGVFALAGLPPAVYRVTAYAYRGAVSEPVEVRVDRAIVACDLQLQQLEEAPLQVVDEGGVAMSDSWVVASLHDLRRGVAQTNDDGFVNLPLAQGARFEVRTGDAFAACAVRRFDADADPMQLVVARP